MDDIIITMRYKKSTKGTHVYEEVDNNQEAEVAVIPTIYIKKSLFGTKYPKTISLTITTLED